MRITTKLAVLAAPALMIVSSSAQAAVLVSYNLNGQPGNETSVAASSGSTGVTGNDLTRGSGLNPNAGQNSFNSNGFTNANGFVTFGYSVLAGFTSTVTDLTFASMASSNGPASINVLASIDNGAFLSVANFAQGTASQNNTISFAAPLTALTSVVFRLAAANQASAGGGNLTSGGTFRLQNYGLASGVAGTPFSINGQVSALATGPIAPSVPEPASWAMIFLGFGIVGASMRYRARSTKIAYA